MPVTAIKDYEKDEQMNEVNVHILEVSIMVWKTGRLQCTLASLPDPPCLSVLYLVRRRFEDFIFAEFFPGSFVEPQFRDN